METKIKSRKAKVQDEGSLEALSRCAEQKKCLLDNNRMLDTALATFSGLHSTARSLAICGGYACNETRVFTLGESIFADAVRIVSQGPADRITLAKMLIAQAGRHE